MVGAVSRLDFSVTGRVESTVYFQDSFFEIPYEGPPGAGVLGSPGKMATYF